MSIPHGVSPVATAMERIARLARRLARRQGRRRWHPPLLYDGRIERARSDEVWRAVAERWGDNLGYPLIQGTEAPPQAEMVACDAAAFAQAVPPAQLHALLAARGVARVWELTEMGPDWELALGLLEPSYGGMRPIGPQKR